MSNSLDYRDPLIREETFADLANALPDEWLVASKSRTLHIRAFFPNGEDDRAVCGKRPGERGINRTFEPAPLDCARFWCRTCLELWGSGKAKDAQTPRLQSEEL